MLNWEMCCELRRAHVTARPLRCPVQCAVQPWDAKHKKTTYYNVLLRCYFVLQSTTMYYSSTTLVLQGTTPLLARTFTTQYYKVLLPCYSVLQSTTRVDGITTFMFDSCNTVHCMEQPMQCKMQRNYEVTFGSPNMEPVH